MGNLKSQLMRFLNNVKKKGRSSFCLYKEFDKAEINADTIRVTEEEIEEAYAEVDPEA